MGRASATCPNIHNTHTNRVQHATDGGQRATRRVQHALHNVQPTLSSSHAACRGRRTTHRTQTRKMQHTTRQSRRGMAAHLIGAAAKSIHIAPAAGPAPTCSDVGGRTLTVDRMRVRLHARGSPVAVACPVACRSMQPMKCSRLQASGYVLPCNGHANRCGAPSRRSDYASRNGKAHAAQRLRMGMSVARRRGDGMRSSPPRPRVRFRD